jgi:hypothetical protein
MQKLNFFDLLNQIDARYLLKRRVWKQNPESFGLPVMLIVLGISKSLGALMVYDRFIPHHEAK